METRDFQALAIFGSYLLTCGGLTALIVRDLLQPASPSQPVPKIKKKHSTTSRQAAPIRLYTFLSVLCLAITWYYMITFFHLSFTTWANENPDGQNRASIASWLRNVQLFRDAWEVALETPGRRFWSQPIFFVTAIWSTYVCDAARARAIRYPWAYMLLGQLVAISFAMDLFFLAVLRYDVGGISRIPSKVSSGLTSSLLVNMVTAVVTTVSVALIPSVTGTAHFMPVLLLPHAALLLPLFSVTWTRPLHRPNTRLVLIWLFVSGAVLQYQTTQDAVRDISLRRHLHRHTNANAGPSGIDMTTGWTTIWQSFRSHPAVSSVGSDVLLASTSCLVWLCLMKDVALTKGPSMDH